MKAEWSKAFIERPRDNLQSHVYIKQKKFVPSYENDVGSEISFIRNRDEI